MTGHAAVELHGVGLTYRSAAGPVEALQGIDLRVERGESTAVVGRSGAGKSSLVAVMTLLRRPTQGRVLVDGSDPQSLSERARARLRGRHVGVVFQSFHLDPTATAQDNVCLPWAFGAHPDLSRRDARCRALELLDALGVADLSRRRPDQMSGGQRQRVAIARALFVQPTLLVADEPTGNLDEETASVVTTDLLRQAAEQDVAVVVVTHDNALAELCSRRITLSRGRIVPETA